MNQGIDPQQAGSSPTTIASWTRFIANGLEQQGLDTLSLLREAGIDPAEFENPNKRIDVSRMTRFWQLACDMSSNPCLPLSLAESAHPDIFSGLGLSMLFSSSVEEVLQRVCHFSHLVSDAADVHLDTESGDNVTITYQINAPVAPAAVEAFMGSSFRIVQELSDPGFRVLEVHLQHDNAANRDCYETFFDAPVTFNAPLYRFMFPREVLYLPCRHSNPELARNMEEWVTNYLGQFSTSSLQARVRQILVECLADGCVSQSDVAGALAMSNRALQRGLQSEDCSFREVLRDTRRDLADKYLKEAGLSLAEITFLLGFSDQSNFTKAYRDWTGQTPARFRQLLAD